MASQTTDRHACHCGKSFLRKEHLRRHQATHGGPTFSCQVCGRSFSRSDLLRRHAGIHGGAAAVPDSRRGKACDTCHANKTKCDGGPQCSLCAKRGVACTYGRRDAASAGGSTPPKKRPRFSPAGADGLASLTVTAPISPPFTESSGTTPSLAAMSVFAGMSACASASASAAGGGGLAHPAMHGGHNHGHGHGHGHDGNSTAWNALHSILAVVTARPDQPALAPVPTMWLSACVDSYFATVHERWPVLHGPGVDAANDDVGVVASMVILSSWQHCDRTFKPLLMEMHNALVEQAFAQLTNDSLDPRQPWPVATYQMTLLNVIFAFESGRTACIKRARHLLGLLVAVLRQNGCFSAEAVERERATHYPGDFVPWVYASVERWKRLAFCALQVDAQLSLLCNQPPLLRRDELDLGLPSTFAMWNAFGLHVFFPRHRAEPWRRGALTLAALDVGQPPQGLPPSGGLLVEDVQACLLGAWADIWVLQQLRRRAAQDPAAAAVARVLDLCRLRLDAVAAAVARPDLHAAYADFLLRAYAARELPADAHWRDRVTARIRDRVLSARMLHRLLALHLRADVQAMRDVSRAGGPDPAASASASAPASGPGTPSPPWEQKALEIHQCAASPDSRAAVVDALAVWSLYQESPAAVDPAHAAAAGHLPAPPGPAAAAADPVVYMALSAAAMVLWTWASTAVPACLCGPDTPALDLAAAPADADVDDWVRHGAVCSCNAPGWLTRFAEALARGGERWELGSIAANNCLSRLNFPMTA